MTKNYKERDFCKWRRDNDKVKLYNNLFNTLLHEQFDRNIKEYTETSNRLDNTPEGEALVFKLVLERYGHNILKKCVAEYLKKKSSEEIWPTKKAFWFEVNVGVNKIEPTKINQYNFYDFINNFNSKHFSLETKQLILEFLVDYYL